MKACCAEVSGTDVLALAGWCRAYRDGAGAGVRAGAGARAGAACLTGAGVGVDSGAIWATAPGISAEPAAGNLCAECADADGAEADGAVTGAALAVARPPLSTNPATPCSASGPRNSCALMVSPGSEFAPMVDSTPSAYPVTTSTCWSNSTQSPGCGVYPSPSGCQRPCDCASCRMDTTPSEDWLGSTRTSAQLCSGHG